MIDRVPHAINAYTTPEDSWGAQNKMGMPTYLIYDARYHPHRTDLYRFDYSMTKKLPIPIPTTMYRRKPLSLKYSSNTTVLGKALVLLRSNQAVKPRLGGVVYCVIYDTRGCMEKRRPPPPHNFVITAISRSGDVATRPLELLWLLFLSRSQVLRGCSFRTYGESDGAILVLHTFLLLEQFSGLFSKQTDHNRPRTFSTR